MKFQPGQSGNPSGRKRGSRNKATLLQERLVKRGGKLLDKLIALAESGDVDSLKFLLSRVIPPARDLPVTVEADGNSLADLSTAIVRQALAGRISADVATQLASALAAVSRIKQTDELEARLQKLETDYAATNRQT